MTIKSRIILSSIVCGLFAAGCLGSPATDEQPVGPSVGQTEQELGASTQAQEREVTYYAEAARINEVGWCYGPYMCYGPKGLRCFGTKTAFSTVEFFDCDTP